MSPSNLWNKPSLRHKIPVCKSQRERVSQGKLNLLRVTDGTVALIWFFRDVWYHRTDPINRIEMFDMIKDKYKRGSKVHTIAQPQLSVMSVKNPQFWSNQAHIGEI